MRCSPMVRMTRSGSGKHAGSRWARDRALRGLARGARDFLPAAIVEGDDERRAFVIRGQLLRFVEEREYVRVETLAVADHPHAYAVFVKLGEILAHEALQQSHQVVDLLERPRPVFGAEGIDGQHLDAEVARRAHRTPQRYDALTMPFPARQSARRRPAPVAVHDDGDVERRAEADAPRGGYGIGQ